MTNFLPALKRSLEVEENCTNIKKFKTNNAVSANKTQPVSTLIQNPAHSQSTFISLHNPTPLLSSSTI
jgi:hypothetical protein